MYMIFKENRPQGNKKYETYEKARQAARKICRKKTDLRLSNKNPNLSDFGYTIINFNRSVD